MLKFRRSIIVKAAVLVLLLWTAADLSATELCAADRSPSNPADVVLSVGIPSGGGATDNQLSDDCFCCSHSVVTPLLFTLAQSTLQVFPVVFSVPDSLNTISLRLYHPPQLV